MDGSKIILMVLCISAFLGLGQYWEHGTPGNNTLASNFSSWDSSQITPKMNQEIIDLSDPKGVMRGAQGEQVYRTDLQMNIDIVGIVLSIPSVIPDMASSLDLPPILGYVMNVVIGGALLIAAWQFVRGGRL